MSEKIIKIELRAEGRLDRFLAGRFPDHSRMFFKRMIEGEKIKVDGRSVHADHALKPGQTVTIDWPQPKERPAPGSVKVKLPFPILHEDEQLFCIDKPAGLLVHPAARGNTEKTLVDFIEPRLSSRDWPDDVRPGLVHRLDRETSGVMIIAKNPSAHAKLSKQFADRTIKKSYAAVVHGVPEKKDGTIEGRIGRDPRARKRFRVAGDGRTAVTRFHVDEILGPEAALLTLLPLTGRTHQIRVHLAAFGHPIVGDAVYGPNRKKYDFVHRHLLHARTLEFEHPKTKKKIRITAELPKDFQTALKRLRLAHA